MKKLLMLLNIVAVLAIGNAAEKDKSVNTVAASDYAYFQ